MTGDIPYIPAGPVGEPSPRPVPPKTPEHDRLAAVRETGANVHVGDFLEWLDTQGLVICGWDEESEQHHPHHERRENLISRHFDLDPAKLAAEQDALLAYVRELNSQ